MALTTEERRLHAIEASRKWRSRNPGMAAIVCRKWKTKNRSKCSISQVRRRAEKAGLKFDLTPEWYESLYYFGSALSGMPFRNGEVPNHNPYTASIDRIDPKGNYTQDNCRLILFAENMFKGKMTDEEMYRIAENILERRRAKQS